MSDSMRDLIRDELTGWHIGSGYYLTTVIVDEARDMADAVLAVLADLPESVIERAAAQIYYWDVNPTTQDWESRPSGGQEDYREGARAAFRAAFGGSGT